MFFKRVELTGFKSFATKTTVDLVPGVTVVVGPNGCGKSNILDCIRWVLGTQSARSMRGKKMQDVIFSGSGALAPLGLAQVTLTLDNSKRTLDMDYDEIQVTRRLYRTGESEYQINKVPCRLRDVHNLFLGTGLGTSSYSILEQGQVDRIINAKPIERRGLFEEASGISKYKARRHQAILKLDRTAQDLKRLDDLVDEVRRQVNSLKRQANKAERFKKFSAELRQVEMELATLRARALGEQIDQVGAEARGFRDRAEELKTQRAAKAAAEQKGHSESDDLNAQLSLRNRELFEIKNEITDREGQLRRLRERIESHGERLSQVDAESAELEEQAEHLDQHAGEIAERTTQAKSDAEQAEEQFDKARENYELLRSEVDDKKRHIETLSREALAHREQLTRCQNDVAIARTLVERHGETKTEAEAEIERATRTLGEHAARGEQLRGQFGEIEAEAETKRADLSSLEIRFTETHGEIADLESELEQTRRDLHQSQARLGTLQELKSSFEGFLRGVREVMKAAEKEKLGGVIGPLAGALKTRAYYEPALEAALGARVQDIVVETPEAGAAAMDYLIAGKFGRSTFWPVEGLAPAPAPDLGEALAEPGVVGHAMGLIEFEPRLTGIVSALLGKTILVESFDAARAAAAKFPGLNYVALDGRMVLEGGAMSGGSADTAGLLGREREIQELTEKVGQLTQSEEELRSNTAMRREAVQELGNRIDAAKTELQALDLQCSHLGKDIETTEQAQGSISETLEKRRGQLEVEIGEIKRNETQIVEKEAAGGEHKQAIHDIEAQLAGERDVAREQGEEFIARGARVAEAKAEIDKVRERLVHLDENRTRLEREQLALEAGRRSRAEERGRLNQGVEEAKGEIAGQLGHIEKLSASRTEFEQKLAEDEAEGQRLAASLQEIRHALEKLERDQSEVENELREKEIRLTQLQTSLDHLREQAIEKFDRDLGEIVEELQEIERGTDELARAARELSDKIERIGPVNLEALEEFEEQSKRHEFLTGQRSDLVESKQQIEASIAEIDETTKKLFHETFDSVRTNFIEMFRRLFEGGKADLVLEAEGDDPLLDGGVEIFAQPPGKKLQSMSLMSGGEKAMTAIALLFALFLHKPAPFAILDEIDAPLDDANVERFKNVLMDFAMNTQFIIITHNKQTMALADALYGVTMEHTGVSKLVSVRFEHADQYLTTAG